MASKVRELSFNLKVDILRKGHEFSFPQVIRLLQFFSRDSTPDDEGTLTKSNIRIRPELSLSFPASDIASIEEYVYNEKSFFLITATFLGLYGSSSPLPTFYTEDLMDESKEDISVTRDFIDMFNNRIFELFFLCWIKYRLFLQVVEENNPQYLEKLFCLLGIGERELREDIPEAYSLIRYLGLFTQFPRSASGLETLLKDALGVMPIEVLPCIKRRVKIHPDQRIQIGLSGNALGNDSFLGEEIEDRMGKFRLKIGPVRSDQFYSLFPGNPGHKRLVLLTRLYLINPLEYDISLSLKEDEVETICLGASQWSRLGWDSWIFSGDYIGETRVTFPPYYT